MTEREVPASLAATGLAEFWAEIRRLLDRNAARRPATIRRPPVDAETERTLRSLLGDGYRSRLELDVLERELVERGVGRDLDDALTLLGYPPSADAERRRVDATRRREARAALESAVAGWQEGWAAEWAQGIVASGNLGGLDADEVERLVADVARAVRLVKTNHGRLSKVDVAALLFGDAHALDAGLRRTTWVERALRYDFGDLDGRELWAAAGLLPDQVSAPVLVWRLGASGTAAAVELAAAAERRHVPVHLSLMSLEGHVRVTHGSVVVVAENPRVVEFAAEQRIDATVVATNGNPSTAVQVLVEQLLASGADVRYHGDFDAAGLAMCRRMTERGCIPWKMDATDYEAAIERARRDGIQLGRDDRTCGDTPWDPGLRTAFNRDRAIVHEEFVLHDLFDGLR